MSDASAYFIWLTLQSVLRENHHASVVWNWYHWVAIVYLNQPSSYDEADVKSRTTDQYTFVQYTKLVNK